MGNDPLLPMETYDPPPEVRCNRCAHLKENNLPCPICGSPEFRIIRVSAIGEPRKKARKSRQRG